MLKKIYTSLFFISSVILNVINLHADEIPVIFVHSGTGPFLEHTLAQAKLFNKRVILIGDDSNKSSVPNGVEYHAISDYCESSNYFKSIYRHMSGIPYKQELACFCRWFLLEEFIRKNNISKAFHAESDVMIYCDITQEYETNFKGCDIALGGQYGFCGGWVAYWSDKSLNAFCSFLKSFYEDREKIDILEKEFRNGGQAFQDDWPLMTNWAIDNRMRFKIVNLSEVIDNATFDSSVWHDYVFVNSHPPCLKYYSMKDTFFYIKHNERIKDIIWKSGIPYCYNHGFGSYIRFKGLHFQGDGKKILAKYRSDFKKDEPEPYASITDLEFDNHGWFPYENQKNLDRIIKERKPICIIEVGSWLGKSAMFMASRLPENGKLYSVDDWTAESDISIKNLSHVQDKLPTLYQQFLSNVKQLRLCDNIVPIRMKKSEAAKSLNVVADLIYLDAAYDEESIYEDIMSWHTKLSKNGIMCGDDWNQFEGIRKGVTRAAEKLGKKVKVDGDFWYFE